MSLRRLLIHRCTAISTGVKTGETEYGKPIYSEVTIKDVHCRADQIKQSVTTDAYGTDFVTKNLLFLSPDQTFSETTLFLDIKDLKGNLVLNGSFGVESSKPVYGRRSIHHHEIILKKEGTASG